MKNIFTGFFIWIFSWGQLIAQTPNQAREQVQGQEQAVEQAQAVIYVNQVAYDLQGPKTAIISTDAPISKDQTFALTDNSGNTVLQAPLKAIDPINDWLPNKHLYKADFSQVHKAGAYKIILKITGETISSAGFQIGQKVLSALTLPAIAHYYRKQRANTPIEWKADRHLPIGTTGRYTDMRGGWCDASGDVSKYLSHLAYTNFMSPQQSGLVTWSLVNAAEQIAALLTQYGIKDSIEQEALWGADYMMRALSDSNFFYTVVFSYFKDDPSYRRIVGLEANSVTTNDYQGAFREGAGMAIASLARISKWGKKGDFTSTQYLEAAERAFLHLQKNNTHYDDDHKENILDDYCALMAATELWKATGKDVYKTAARKRAANLSHRITPQGYFRADDSLYIFWHASDAGLPIVALERYVTIEKDASFRDKALKTISQALAYNLKVTGDVSNPFGYARQTINFHGKVQDNFFIPHDNVSGWWWQGENARLASLATAAILGAKLLYSDKEHEQQKQQLYDYANDQLDWILGRNPYSICFMYGLGSENVPYMHSKYGHGSERGGISNGITGQQADGSGIEFKLEDAGNEWRWTEQWIPHAAWFLQAITALEQ